MEPEGLLFSETHEWVRLAEESGAKLAIVGISAFAVEQLTDLVYMELPEVGRRVRAGEEFGEVESVKAVSPLYSPVDGEVIEVNTGLPDKLESLEARVRSLVELIQNLKRENADLKGTLREARTRLSREEELNHRWIKERVQIKTRITRVMHELDSLESAVGSKEVALDKDHRG